MNKLRNAHVISFTGLSPVTRQPPFCFTFLLRPSIAFTFNNTSIAFGGAPFRIYEKENAHNPML